jgi:ferric-dicitrate binding protein FerR (iron transport regulator)
MRGIAILAMNFSHSVHTLVIVPPADERSGRDARAPLVLVAGSPRSLDKRSAVQESSPAMRGIAILAMNFSHSGHMLVIVPPADERSGRDARAPLVLVAGSLRSLDKRSAVQESFPTMRGIAISKSAYAQSALGSNRGFRPDPGHTGPEKVYRRSATLRVVRCDPRTALRLSRLRLLMKTGPWALA